jgi:undecaprenyl-diphosphatase
MNLFESMFLGVLQGFTEFLPISSSGHLVIAQALLDIKRPDSVIYEVLLHVGTLCAIVVVFYSRIAGLLRFVFREGWNKAKARGVSRAFWHDEDGRFLSLIVIASIPTAVIGFLFEKPLSSLFNQPTIVGVALCVTGLILLASRWERKTTQQVTVSQMSALVAMVIGIAQGIAITPGISRSGITITAALVLGVARKDAADFSFILVIPATLGAVVLSLSHSVGGLQEIGVGGALVGLIAAFVSGIVALRILLRFVWKGKLYSFAWYCLMVGVFAILYFL